jgi:hypothetical protein
MRYAMMPGKEIAGAPGSPGVLGYLYNHGGLNNQKMALVGLILSGIKTGQAINLPYIYNRDQRTDEEYVTRIEEIFEIEPILDFAGRNGLVVLTDQPSGERGGWEYFSKFPELLLKVPDLGSLETILDAAASLRPRIVSSSDFIRVEDFVRRSLAIDTVVQLRIEADWREHSANVLERFVGSESFYFDFLRIMSKVGKSFPELRRVYVTADEKSMPAPKHEIRTACMNQLGIDLLWKSDLLPAAVVEDLTPLDLSLIDYEIARRCPRFVGTTRSTFANMLGVEMFAATRKAVRGHYIYDGPGDVLIERRDNGFMSSPHGAGSPTHAVGLLGADVPG